MRLRTASAAVLLSLAGNVAAHADSISLTLLNPAQSAGASGGTLSFSATVAAPTTNTSLEYLNTLRVNITPANAFTIDQSNFVNSYPFYLAPGDSFTGTLFALTVPAGSTAGTYIGNVSLSGGNSSAASTTLSTQSFSVNVTPSATVTPEPSSLLLLGTGALGVAAVVRRRIAGQAGMGYR